MPALRPIKLAAVFFLPFVAVLIRDKAVFVPQGARRRLDRFFPHRLQIHTRSLRWLLKAPPHHLTPIRRATAAYSSCYSAAIHEAPSRPKRAMRSLSTGSTIKPLTPVVGGAVDAPASGPVTHRGVLPIALDDAGGDANRKIARQEVWRLRSSLQELADLLEPPLNGLAQDPLHRNEPPKPNSD